MSKNDNDTLFYDDESNFLCPAQGQDLFLNFFLFFVISLDVAECIVCGVPSRVASRCSFSA